MLFTLPALCVHAQEICDNGIDDDGNGLIDLNDPACPCSTLISGTPSFIPNPSFEELLVSSTGTVCCPYGYNVPAEPPWFTCAVSWQQATVPTTDLFHSCGLFPDVFPTPPPDGEAYVGMRMVDGWQEYVGACLTYPGPPNPLQAGVEYTLSFHVAGTSIRNSGNTTTSLGAYYSADPIPLALFGKSNCVPFPVSTTGCPVSEDWVQLAAMDYYANGQWDHLSFTFTPTQEIRTIMFGTGCVLPPSFTGGEDSLNYTPYLLLDDLHLTAAIDQVMIPVMSVGHVCTNNVVVTADPPPALMGYQWYLNGVALDGQTGMTLDVSAAGLESGLYTMAGMYNGECLMGSTHVAIPDPPDPLMDIVPASGCVPLTVSFTDASGPLSVASGWDLGDGEVGVGPTVVHTYETPGTYDVTLAITTAMGCVVDTTLLSAVTVYPPLQGTITATPNPAEVESPVVGLTGTAVGDVVSWWWDLGAASPSTATTTEVSATFPAEPGDYPVMLVVTSSAGCVDTVRSVVRIVEAGVIEMPNVFSPNADGHNDRFVPLDYNGTPALLEVFNRWGQKVFSTRALAQGWDGGGVPDGTYYFVVTPDDAQVEKQAGHVTLVR